MSEPAAGASERAEAKFRRIGPAAAAIVFMLAAAFAAVAVNLGASDPGGTDAGRRPSVQGMSPASTVVVEPTALRPHLDDDETQGHVESHGSADDHGSEEERHEGADDDD